MISKKKTGLRQNSGRFFFQFRKFKRMRGALFVWGAIFHFSQKIGLKSTKNMRFCILHKPMGGLEPPPPPPGYATGAPPFDLSHAEKFDHEKLQQIMIKSLCICFKCHYICTPSLKMHLFQVLLHISPFPRQYYFQLLSQI